MTKMPADWDPSLPRVGLLVDEMTTLVARAAAAICRHRSLNCDAMDEAGPFACNRR